MSADTPTCPSCRLSQRSAASERPSRSVYIESPDNPAAVAKNASLATFVLKANDANKVEDANSLHTCIRAAPIPNLPLLAMMAMRDRPTYIAYSAESIAELRKNPYSEVL